MSRSLLALPILLTAVAVVGCGSSDATPKISADAATSAVERAADVELTAGTVPDDAAKQGLVAMASNTATASADGQIVFVFTLKDGDTVGKLSDQLKASVPAGPAQVMTRENVVVVYGATGADHAAAVRTALDRLG
jgi:hypothetical protein